MIEVILVSLSIPSLPVYTKYLSICQAIAMILRSFVYIRFVQNKCFEFSRSPGGFQSLDSDCHSLLST